MAVRVKCCFQVWVSPFSNLLCFPDTILPLLSATAIRSLALKLSLSHTSLLRSFVLTVISLSRNISHFVPPFIFVSCPRVCLSCILSTSFSLVSTSLPSCALRVPALTPSLLFSRFSLNVFVVRSLLLCHSSQHEDCSSSYWHQDY